jgi:hypothetical protein
VVLAGASHPSARGFKSLALHKALNIASSVLLHLGRATDRAREGIPIAPVKAIKYTSSCGSLSSGEGSAPRALDTRGAVAYTRRPHLCTSRGGVRPGGVALDKRAPQAAQAQGLGPGLPAKENHPAPGRSDGVWPSLGTSASGSVTTIRQVIMAVGHCLLIELL